MRSTPRMTAFAPALPLSGLLWLVASVASAQTPDALYRSWDWRDDLQSARGSALGGAIVAEPADATGALLYPAGLSLVSEPDLRLSVRFVGTGSIGLDEEQRGWRPGEIAFAQPVGLRWGVGLYVRDRHDTRVELNDTLLPGGVSDVGWLDVRCVEAGAAAGYALLPSLRIGMRAGGARLDVEGERTTTSPDGRSTAAASDFDDTVLRLGAGILLAPHQRVQVAAHWESRAAWRGALTAPAGAVGPYSVIAPERLVMGVLYRPSSFAQFLGQVERVRWAQVHDALAAGGAIDRGDFVRKNGVDVGLGLELRPQMGDFAVWRRVVLRVGWRLRTRGLLEYGGGDPLLVARFPGAREVRGWGLGLAVGKLEVAWAEDDPAPRWVFGVRQVF